MVSKLRYSESWRTGTVIRSRNWFARAELCRAVVGVTMAGRPKVLFHRALPHFHPVPPHTKIEFFPPHRCVRRRRELNRYQRPAILLVLLQSRATSVYNTPILQRHRLRGSMISGHVAPEVIVIRPSSDRNSAPAPAVHLDSEPLQASARRIQSAMPVGCFCS